MGAYFIFLNLLTSWAAGERADDECAWNTPAVVLLRIQSVQHDSDQILQLVVEKRLVELILQFLLSRNKLITKPLRSARLYFVEDDEQGDEPLAPDLRLEQPQRVVGWVAEDFVIAHERVAEVLAGRAVDQHGQHRRQDQQAKHVVVVQHLRQVRHEHSENCRIPTKRLKNYQRQNLLFLMF